ncbi:hypothetical protein HD806DRAFT_546623 [Xylariaceae sp. AK1471]|nr:hypothetical protein HD806DRAFT_546623 [Xylariaceae sp. AK1471]
MSAYPVQYDDKGNPTVMKMYSSKKEAKKAMPSYDNPDEYKYADVPQYEYADLSLKIFYICGESWGNRLFAVEVHTGYGAKGPLGVRPGSIVFHFSVEVGLGEKTKMRRETFESKKIPKQEEDDETKHVGFKLS